VCTLPVVGETLGSSASLLEEAERVIAAVVLSCDGLAQVNRWTAYIMVQTHYSGEEEEGDPGERLGTEEKRGE
jgi:hypothetical protein